MLCGGLGTRLKSVIKDIPKPMAPIKDKPFLEFIFIPKNSSLKYSFITSYLYETAKITSFIPCSLRYLKDEFLGIKITYSIEKEPLGTGGAIREALEFVKNEAYVLNGDTFFNINLTKLKLNGSQICLALKQMQDFDRYGTVELYSENYIKLFKEKEFTKQGLINGGIYLLSKDIFKGFTLQEKFSFEEFLQQNHKNLKARAEIFDDYFIDIGVPEDYYRFTFL